MDIENNMKVCKDLLSGVLCSLKSRPFQGQDIVLLGPWNPLFIEHPKEKYRKKQKLQVL